MQINSADRHTLTDKTADLAKMRDTRGVSTKTERADSEPKQPDRDTFVPSRAADDGGIYKPPTAWQAKSAPQADAALASSIDDPAEIKTMPQISEILAKIKAATPEDLLSAQAQAVSENIGALLENKE